MKVIIDKKQLRIKSYIYDSNANECWLIIHSPHDELETFFDLDDWTIEMFKHSASSLSHDFDRIYLIHSSPENVIEIWRKGGPLIPKPPLSNYGMPIYKDIRVYSTFGDDGIVITLNSLPVQELIQLQPLNPSYKKIFNHE